MKWARRKACSGEPQVTVPHGAHILTDGRPRRLHRPAHAGLMSGCQGSRERELRVPVLLVHSRNTICLSPGGFPWAPVLGPVCSGPGREPAGGHVGGGAPGEGRGHRGSARLTLGTFRCRSPPFPTSPPGFRGGRGVTAVAKGPVTPAVIAVPPTHGPSSNSCQTITDRACGKKAAHSPLFPSPSKKNP